MSLIPHKLKSNLENLPVSAYQPQPGAPSAIVSVPDEPMQLGDYFKLVLRHWKLLSWSAIAGCLVGLLVTLIQSPSYRTKTSIEIQNINGDFLNMKQAHPMSDEAQGSDALMDLQTQIEVLQSASLADATKLAMKQAGVKQAWRVNASPLGRFFTSKGSLVSDNILDDVADSVKVRAVGQTRIIQIQVDAPNPTLAADFANMLVTEYIHQNIRARSQMTEAAEDWTRSQLVDMRRKLETSEQALQEYAAKYGLVFTSERQTHFRRPPSPGAIRPAARPHGSSRKRSKTSVGGSSQG